MRERERERDRETERERERGGGRERECGTFVYTYICISGHENLGRDDEGVYAIRRNRNLRGKAWGQYECFGMFITKL